MVLGEDGECWKRTEGAREGLRVPGMKGGYRRVLQQQGGCQRRMKGAVGSRDVNFEPAGPGPGPKSGPAGLLRGLRAMLPGSCRAQNEQRSAKGYTARLDAGLKYARMLNAGLDAGPN